MVHSTIVPLVSGNKSNELFLQYVLKTRRGSSCLLLTDLYRSVVAHRVKSVQWALE